MMVATILALGGFGKTGSVSGIANYFTGDCAATTLKADSGRASGLAKARGHWGSKVTSIESNLKTCWLAGRLTVNGC